MTHINRRDFVAGALAAPLVSATSAARSADGYPSRPIRWIVPFPPGGAVDTVARVVSKKMSETIGQPVTVDNRPGSGGLIGTDAATKAAPDGYTIVINSTGLAVDKWFYPRVPYDARKDLAPVVLLASVPSVLVVPPTSPWTSVDQLVAAAKKAPRRYTYASAGKGTSLHLASALFVARAGIELLHVPYKGSSAAASDLLAGRVDMMIDSVTSQRANIAAGAVRPLAVTSSAASPLFPGVPPLADAANLPGYEVLTWCGIFAPVGTPAPVVQRLTEELTHAVRSEEVRRSLAALGITAEGGEAEVLGALLNKETERWNRLIPQYRMNAEQ